MIESLASEETFPGLRSSRRADDQAFLQDLESTLYLRRHLPWRSWSTPQPWWPSAITKKDGACFVALSVLCCPGALFFFLVFSNRLHVLV
ncbi:unnamed protein product [Cylicostephanus goldi]|uniref:Uncharacterized protein n=1 Tax=Cylicostephanus goldi TaxID=71465 RepID=A0A3P7N035_CYLGO|nr:unnamed protein product [Cylicostephanus goldi]